MHIHTGLQQKAWLDGGGQLLIRHRQSSRITLVATSLIRLSECTENAWQWHLETVVCHEFQFLPLFQIDLAAGQFLLQYQCISLSLMRIRKAIANLKNQNKLHITYVLSMGEQENDLTNLRPVLTAGSAMPKQVQPSYLFSARGIL